MMETEDKAKVVESVLGGKMCSIPCYTSCFVSVYLGETVDVILFFQMDRGKTAIARQEIEQILPPNRYNDLCLVFCFHPSSLSLTDIVLYSEKDTLCLK